MKGIDTFEVMEFFRSDEFIETLSTDDRDEIACACLSYSEFLSDGLSGLFEKFESQDKEWVL